MATSKETYSKKEKEKKRLKQREDKRIKMEERKAGKKDGNALDQMMAYLDENGNLTDIPPDPGRIVTFAAQDIQVGVPRQEDTATEFRTGIVNFYNRDKGFGFINEQPGNERIFFHVNEILQPVEEGNKVKYLVEKGPRGWSAIQVSKI